VEPEGADDPGVTDVESEGGDRPDVTDVESATGEAPGATEVKPGADPNADSVSEAAPPAYLHDDPRREDRRWIISDEEAAHAA
jgi:hypothetical protein